MAFAVGHNGVGAKVVIGKLDERSTTVSGYTGSVSGYASMEQDSKEEEVWRKPNTGKQFRSAFAQELEMEEGAARGQQSEAIRGRDSMQATMSSREPRVECVHGNSDCAVCAVTDEQVEAVRRENLRLKAQIERVGSQFKHLHCPPDQIERVQGDEEKHAKLEAEVEQLTWKLRKMEESRRVYEDATSQLGSFLELVSSQLTVSGRWTGLKCPHFFLVNLPFQIPAGQHIASSGR